MELSFSELRTKEVVNTQDGRKLGKASDILLCYPENRWIGLIVPSGKGMCLKKQELFIDLKSIVKIGEDVILVNLGAPKKETDKKDRCAPPFKPNCHGEWQPPHNERNERNFDEFE